MSKQAINIYIGNHANALYVEDWVYLLLISFRAAGYDAVFSTTTIETGKLNIILECFNQKSYDYLRERSRAGAQSVLIATEFLTGDTFNCFEEKPADAPQLLGNSLSWLPLRLQTKRARERREQAIYLKSFRDRARYFFMAAELSKAIWTVGEAQTEAYLSRFSGKKHVAQVPMTFLDHEVYRIEPPSPRKDHDIFFGGTLGSYRANLFEKWRQKGWKITTTLPNQPNLLRNHMAARSRLVLDLKQHQGWPYVSNFRLHYHLCRGDYIASESRLNRTHLCRYVHQLPEDTFGAVDALLAGSGDFYQEGLRMRERFRDEQPAQQVFKEFLQMNPL